MQEPAIEVEPEVFGPPLDDAGLPVAGRRMTEPQAWPALWLKSSLAVHRDRLELDWDVRFDSPVDYHDAQGKSQRVFPDVYVLRGFGRPKAPLLTWVLDRRPQVVVEFSSRRSLGRDLGAKLEIYRELLRVQEYFVFDVDLRRIPRLLEGYRLGEGGEYRPIPETPALTSSGVVRLHSAELGLDLEVVRESTFPGGFALRPFLPGQSQPIPTVQEAKAVREQEQALREQEQALRAAREEIERLRRALEEREAGEA